MSAAAITIKVKKYNAAFIWDKIPLPGNIIPDAHELRINGQSVTVKKQL